MLIGIVVKINPSDQKIKMDSVLPLRVREAIPHVLLVAWFFANNHPSERERVVVVRDPLNNFIVVVFHHHTGTDVLGHVGNL